MRKESNLVSSVKKKKPAWNSVHIDGCCIESNKRFLKGKEQRGKPFFDKNLIIKMTNEFLLSIGMKIYSEYNYVDLINMEGNINKKIKTLYNHVNNEKDIVWMKFTKSGYLGCVACSNDINFQIPKNKSNYTEKTNKKWKYNSSGIIIHSLRETWDTSFVLIFPLVKTKGGLSRKERHNMEKKIGDYLIDKKVPILDFYSHKFF